MEFTNTLPEGYDHITVKGGKNGALITTRESQNGAQEVVSQWQVAEMKDFSPPLVESCSDCSVFCGVAILDQVLLSTLPLGSMHAFTLRVAFMVPKALRVHVPKEYILWAQGTYIGTTLGPKYILFGYMDP